MLDNFESNLKSQAEPTGASGQPAWVCQDPAWDRCLSSLAKDLIGSPSRVLITCRRPLAALAEGVSHPILLGPLPPQEAALFLKEHPVLSRMVFGNDAVEKALALRLLNASRFHPLLMDRLARLASDPNLRAQLLQALEKLEQTKDFSHLPALFATKHGDAKELAYLNDALSTSLDQLIQGASPDARRLLWMIAAANDSIELGLLKSVWSGDSHERQQLRQLRLMLDNMPSLPPDLQEKLKRIPPESRAMLDSLPPKRPIRPDMAPFLRHLISVGLATEERTGREDDNPHLTCHELVGERIRVWMEQHQHDRGDLTENAIRLDFAEPLEAVFIKLQDKNMKAALRAGSQALVYCVQARAYRPACRFCQPSRHKYTRSAPARGIDSASSERYGLRPGGQITLVMPPSPSRCDEAR